MLPWIQVYSNLPEHPKIYALVDRLNLRRNYEAVGIVVSLWLWAAKNAPDGDLSGFPDRAIGGAIGYPANLTKKLLAALVDSGWLDQSEAGGYRLHDWEEHASMLIGAMERQKILSKERSRRYRERKALKNQDFVEIDCVTRHVTHHDTSVTNHVTHHAQNVTRHAPTRPEQNEPNQNQLSPPEEGASSSWSEEPLSSIFSPRLTLSETAMGELKELSQGMEEGLLIRAMDIAQDNGSLVWSYVRGILQNWRKRGIRTVAAAEQRERQRTTEKAAQPKTPPAVGTVAAADVAESRRGMERLREELGK